MLRETLEKLLLLLAVIILGTGMLMVSSESASAWGTKENSDVTVMQQLDKQISQSNRVVGMPAITNFFEKAQVRMLYELRDDPNYRTYSYIVTLDGRFVKICDSIGYGINMSIQFANPLRPADISETATRDFAGYELDIMPQAEPNGLFMPEGLAATYVMCLDPSTADGDAPKLVPVYMEPDIAVSPFPLEGSSQ